MEPRLDRLFTIGGFAEQTGLSAKSLRRYDRSGLLVPARVDPDTGYRLYSAAQLDDAARLRLLRDLDVPLAEIAELMRGDDLERTRDVLRHHRDRMRERQTRVESILARIERLVGEELGLLPYAMEMADYDACTVISARTVVRLEQIDGTVDGLAARLRGSLAGHGLVEDGREFSLMHNVMTWYDGADVEVCLPVAPPEGGGAGGAPPSVAPPPPPTKPPNPPPPPCATARGATLPAPMPRSSRGRLDTAARSAGRHASSIASTTATPPIPPSIAPSWRCRCRPGRPPCPDPHPWAVAPFARPRPSPRPVNANPP